MNQLRQFFTQVFSRENQLALALGLILALLAIFTANDQSAWFLYGDF
jgi:hypothetical protein